MFQDSQTSQQGNKVRRRQWLGSILGVVIIFLGVYAFTRRGRIQVSDEAAVLATAVSLATEGTLAINNLAWIEPLVPNTVHLGRGGHWYSKYFPGNAVLGAWLYRLSAAQPDRDYWWNAWSASSVRGVRAALLVNPLLGAVTLGLLWLVVARLYDPRVAWLTVLAIGLGSDWWYQSRGFLSEVGAGCFLLLTLVGAESRRPWMSSVALGCSLLFRPTNLLGLPLWIWAVWCAGGDRRAWLSGLGMSVGLAGLVWYNWARFGSPLAFGYGGESFSLSVRALVPGLYGVLLSPGRSVFLYSPVLLLAIPGAVWLWRQRRDLALALGLVIGAYVGMVALWHRWDGGWTWGSRLLTPVLPLAGVLVGAGIAWPLALPEGAWRRGLLALAIVCLVAGLGMNGLAMLRDPVDTLVRTVGGGEVAYEDTLFSLEYAFPVLQARYILKRWEWRDLDIVLARQRWD